MPNTVEEWQEIEKRFAQRWNLPNCCGAIDGKHVVMRQPPHAGSTHFNYKKQHSIVLLAVCDADYRLLYVDAGLNGRISDGGVYNRSNLAKALAENTVNLPPPKLLPGGLYPVNHCIVADAAFAKRPYILKPIPKDPDYLDRIYNYRISRARRTIENVFGLMAARFRIFRSYINLNNKKTTKVIN